MADLIPQLSYAVYNASRSVWPKAKRDTSPAVQWGSCHIIVCPNLDNLHGQCAAKHGSSPACKSSAGWLCFSDIGVAFISCTDCAVSFATLGLLLDLWPLKVVDEGLEGLWALERTRVGTLERFSGWVSGPLSRAAAQPGIKFLPGLGLFVRPISKVSHLLSQLICR